MTQDAMLFIGLISLGLAVPLAYAGHTLLGMRGKTFTPLLRTRDTTGISHLLIRAIPPLTQPSFQRRFLWSQSITS